MAFAGCMDGDWDEPSNEQSPWGNNSIEETNVITIGELKERYSSVFNASYDQAVQITEPLQVKGWITGNDIGGNIYSQVSLQDETGAIIIGIQQSGLMGYLPIGQQIIVELNGLYVGAYRKQCQIGVPYNGGIGRIDKFTWQKHFRAIGAVDAAKVEELKTDFSPEMDMFENCAKIMTFRGVTLKDADADGSLKYIVSTYDPYDMIIRDGRRLRGCCHADRPCGHNGHFYALQRRVADSPPHRQRHKKSRINHQA